MLIIYDGSSDGGRYYVVEDVDFLSSEAARFGRVERFFDVIIKHEMHFMAAEGKWFRLYDIDGTVLAGSSYSNPNRLDLSELMTRAHTISYNDLYVSRVEAQEIVRNTENNPQLRLLARPQSYEPHDYWVEVSFPFQWADYSGSSIFTFDEIELLEDWISKQTSIPRDRFELSRSGGDQTFFNHHERLPGTQEIWVAAVWDQGGQVVQSVGFHLTKPLLRVRCNQPDCAAFEKLELAALPDFIVQKRDPTVLSNLLDAASEPQRSENSGLYQSAPSIAEMRADQITVSAPHTVQYRVSWYSRLAD